jgi:predicted amidohydrolase YtcJ
MKCFLNGKVYTVNDRQPWAEAVVVDGGRIVYVGRSNDARVLAGAGASFIDLEGRLMLPGLIDDHVHLVWGGQHVLGIDLRPSNNRKQFCEILEKYAAMHHGEWIVGGDWDHEKWDPPHFPHREWIDHFSAETPIFVQRFDGHMGLANTAALNRAGITASTPDPAGGSIERDTRGEPTGILKDLAMNLVTAVIPPASDEQLERAVLQGIAEVRKNGVTSIHDITLPEHWPIYRRFAEEGRLTCRIFTRLPIEGYEALVQEGITVPTGNEWLTRGSLKAFADGSLGSNTAWFFAPYANEPSTSGLAMEVLSSGHLRAWALDADRKKLQLSIHAIGDRANASILDIFEEITRTNPSWDRRFRIEHAQHVRQADLPRFVAQGVIVSAQPYHAADDGVWAAQRIGTARCREAYMFRSFIDAGVKVCFGSDWTVAPLSPLLGMYAAVTRRTLDGKNPGGWIPEEKITVEQAIRCYTINNAFAEFREFDKGSIEKGKFADFTVLDRNILRLPSEQIPETRVVMTVVGGEVVWENS